MSKTVQFTDTSENANTYNWNFGDGTTSQERNPIHTYVEYGDYNVVLTVTNNMGNTDVFQQNISLVNPNSNLPPDPPETEEQQDEQQDDQQQDEQQEEQQTYTEQKPNSPPSGYQFAPPVFNLMDGTLSPQGQWIWDAKSTVNPMANEWVSNSSTTTTTTTTESDDSDTSGNTQPTTQTYTLTGTITKFGTTSAGPFNISNENYPTLLSDISIGDVVSVVGSPGVKVITDFNLAEKRITISPGIPDAFYGDSLSFSMTIVSEQIGLQPGDTSGNTGGDTGGNNGDTGDGGDDDGYGDGDTGSGGIPRP